MMLALGVPVAVAVDDMVAEDVAVTVWVDVPVAEAVLEPVKDWVAVEL